MHSDSILTFSLLPTPDRREDVEDGTPKMALYSSRREISRNPSGVLVSKSAQGSGTVYCPCSDNNSSQFATAVCGLLVAGATLGLLQFAACWWLGQHWGYCYDLYTKSVSSCRYQASSAHWYLCFVPIFFLCSY